MFWVFLGCAITLPGIFYVVPFLLRRRQEATLRAGCRNSNTLTLTYDDGPGEETTTKLLEILEAYQAKATFYLLGMRVDSASSTVEKLKSAGHELASHSHSHLNAWKVSPTAALRDVKRGFDTLDQHEIEFHLFRPPYGKLNLLTWSAARRRGLKLGWWTIVSGDTFAELPDPQSIVSTVEREGGGVVLMHDFDRGTDRMDYVVSLTRQLLEAAKKHGWRVCTQGELLKI